MVHYPKSILKTGKMGHYSPSNHRDSGFLTVQVDVF